MKIIENEVVSNDEFMFSWAKGLTKINLIRLVYILREIENKGFSRVYCKREI